jgi:putative ABC transport system permease protein
MDVFLKDLRFSLRMLIKKPGFTIVVLLTLAVGIGANTAIFSIVNGVLLRPLAFEDSDRLIWMWGRFSLGNSASVSPPDFLDYRAQNQSFERLSAMMPFASFNLIGDGEPERVAGARVTTDFFQTLGVAPVQGRDFVPEEEQAGNNRVVLISQSLWSRRFGADPSIIGQPVFLDGENYTVVGVIPDKSALPQQAHIWTPLTFEQPNMKVRRFHFLRPIGRLKHDITLEQAQSEMDSIAGTLEQQYPDSNTTWGLRLVRLEDQIIGDVRTPLLVLLCAVGFVLLIACANVANLLLARASTRQKEMAIRSALGAGRRRIIQQLMTESIVLAFAGGMLGLLLAIWGTRLIVAMMPGNIPRTNEIGIDNSVMLFTILVSLLTGLLFGLTPAIQSSKSDLQDALKDGGKGQSTGSRHNRTRGILVAAEVALALVLSISAALLIQSFHRLQQVDTGFNSENLLTMRISLPQSKYGQQGQTSAFFDDLLRRVASLPGVISAGTTTHLPFGAGGGDTYFTIEGRPFADPNQKVTAVNPQVSYDYMSAIGMQLLRGRHFTEADTQGPPRTVIINQTLADRFFEGDDPLGKRLIIDMGNPVPCEIVGVVRDVKQYSLDQPLRAEMYIPSIEVGSANLILRTTHDPSSLTAAVQNEVRAIDKNQPISNISTMDQLISNSVAEPRFRTLLLMIFACVALLLASIGIYGVMSYTVTQRTHEIGIRMALGAGRGDVLKLMVGQAVTLTLAGVAAGILAALVLTRLMESLLFGVTANDPTTFIVVSVLLTAIGFLASYIPARRATKVDPMTALRYE